MVVRLGQPPESACFADLAKAYLRPLRDGSNVFDMKRGAGLRFKDRLLDIFDVPVETDLPNVNLLLTLLDKAAAGVGIVVGELLLDLADTEPIGNQFVRINTNLVFACDSSKT